MKIERVEFDTKTRNWFKSNPFAQTTVTQCECCGLCFKPSLGHKCKKKGEQTNGNQKC